MEWLIALFLLLSGTQNSQPAPTVVIHYASGLVFEYQSSGVTSRDMAFGETSDTEALLTIDDIELKISVGDVACLPLSRLPVEYHRLAEADQTDTSYGCLRFDDAMKTPTK